MLPTLSVGSLVVPTRDLVLLIGAWFVLSVVERSSRAVKLDAEATYSLAVTGLVSGFVGARLVFAALHWSAYQQNLSGIIWPLTSGYHALGGFVIGLSAGIFHARARQLPAGRTLDALAPGLVAALMVVGLADFLGGPGYGTETTLPWSIDVFGIRRHPVQLYEIFTGAAAIWVWVRLLRQQSNPGTLFLTVVAVYSAGRLFFDAFRANALLTDSGLHVTQIGGLILMLGSVLVLARRQPFLTESSE